MPHVDKTCTTHHACDCISADLDSLRAENKRLEAENERLRGELVAACQPTTLEMLEEVAKKYRLATVSVPDDPNLLPLYVLTSYGKLRYGYMGKFISRDKALTLLKGGGDALHS